MGTVTDVDQKDLVISALVKALYGEWPTTDTVEFIVWSATTFGPQVTEAETAAVLSYFEAAPHGFEITD